MHGFDSDFNNGKSTLARAVAGLVGAVLLAFSALTSAAFFYTYAPDVFSFLSPTLSPYISAFVGVMVFEGLSVAWRWLRAHDADTERQLALAGVGAWMALIGGLLVTAVFFALQTSLLEGVLDETTRMALNILGAVLMILGISGGFGLYHFYADSGAAHSRASQEAELRAMQASAQHKVNQESTQATLSRTLAEIRRSLPKQAQRQGVSNARMFFDERFRTPGEVKWAARIGGGQVEPVEELEEEDDSEVPFDRNEGRNPRG